MHASNIRHPASAHPETELISTPIPLFVREAVWNVLCQAQQGGSTSVLTAPDGDVQLPDGVLRRPDGDVELSDEFQKTFRVPPCPRCGGVLKPNVVFFGDGLPVSRANR